jgi:hypothetical protein
MLTIGFIGLFTVLSSIKGEIAFPIMEKISFYTLISIGLFISWEIFNMLIKAFQGICPKCFGSKGFKILYKRLWFLIFIPTVFFLVMTASILLPALYMYFIT